jgi:hypothetical protein
VADTPSPPAAVALGQFRDTPFRRPSHARGTQPFSLTRTPARRRRRMGRRRERARAVPTRTALGSQDDGVAGAAGRGRKEMALPRAPANACAEGGGESGRGRCRRGPRSVAKTMASLVQPAPGGRMALPRAPANACAEVGGESGRGQCPQGPRSVAMAGALPGQPAAAGASARPWGRRTRGPKPYSVSISRARSRSTAFVCNWEMRDSVTPRTSPISRSVRFS